MTKKGKVTNTDKNKYIGVKLTQRIDTLGIVTRDFNNDDAQRYIKRIHADLHDTLAALKMKLKLVKGRSKLDDKNRLKEKQDSKAMSIVREIRDAIVGSSLLIDEPVLETIQADDYRKNLTTIGDYIKSYDKSIEKLEMINRTIGYLQDEIKDTKKVLRQSTAYIAELESIEEYKRAIKWTRAYIDSLKKDAIPVNNNDDVLSILQRECIDRMSEKAREFSDADIYDDDFDRRVQYVRNREVVSHQGFIELLTGIMNSADDTIKNCFVTKTTMSNGGRLLLNERTDAESRLFDGLFDDQHGKERPIYGAINLIDDPDGVSSCRGYNISYVVFKESVKSRMTLTYVDSMVDNGSLDIGTFRYMNHIVNTIDPDILDLYASGRKFDADDTDELQSDGYIEAQIHGKVRLSRDVKRFMIDPDLSCDERVINLVTEFRRNFKGDVVFQIIGGEKL